MEENNAPDLDDPNIEITPALLTSTNQIFISSSSNNPPSHPQELQQVQSNSPRFIGDHQPEDAMATNDDGSFARARYFDSLNNQQQNHHKVSGDFQSSRDGLMGHNRMGAITNDSHSESRRADGHLTAMESSNYRNTPDSSQNFERVLIDFSSLDYQPMPAAMPNDWESPHFPIPIPGRRSFGVHAPNNYTTSLDGHHQIPPLLERQSSSLMRENEIERDPLMASDESQTNQGIGSRKNSDQRFSPTGNGGYGLYTGGATLDDYCQEDSVSRGNSFQSSRFDTPTLNQDSSRRYDSLIPTMTDLGSITPGRYKHLEQYQQYSRQHPYSAPIVPPVSVRAPPQHLSMDPSQIQYQQPKTYSLNPHPPQQPAFQQSQPLKPHNLPTQHSPQKKLVNKFFNISKKFSSTSEFTHHRIIEQARNVNDNITFLLPKLSSNSQISTEPQEVKFYLTKLPDLPLYHLPPLPETLYTPTSTPPTLEFWIDSGTLCVRLTKKCMRNLLNLFRSFQNAPPFIFVSPKDQKYRLHQFLERITCISWNGSGNLIVGYTKETLAEWTGTDEGKWAIIEDVVECFTASVSCNDKNLWTFGYDWQTNGAKPIEFPGIDEKVIDWALRWREVGAPTKAELQRALMTKEEKWRTNRQAEKEMWEAMRLSQQEVKEKLGEFPLIGKVKKRSPPVLVSGSRKRKICEMMFPHQAPPLQEQQAINISDNDDDSDSDDDANLDEEMHIDEDKDFEFISDSNTNQDDECTGHLTFWPSIPQKQHRKQCAQWEKTPLPSSLPSTASATVVSRENTVILPLPPPIAVMSDAAGGGGGNKKRETTKAGNVTKATKDMKDMKAGKCRKGRNVAFNEKIEVQKYHQEKQQQHEVLVPAPAGPRRNERRKATVS